MIKFLARNLNASYFNTLSARIIYLLLLMAILIQSISLGITSANSTAINKINIKLNGINSRQEQIGASMNTLQTNIMQVQAQLYRLQGDLNK